MTGYRNDLNERDGYSKKGEEYQQKIKKSPQGGKPKQWKGTPKTLHEIPKHLKLETKRE